MGCSRVLFVSPHHEDAGMLTLMLRPAPFEFVHVSSLHDARANLSGGSYGAVLTEACLPDGDWKDVLSLVWDLGTLPAVIVTHRFADDRFWAEVLNLGCYDMLAQPFDACEVRRILTLACEQPPAKPSLCSRPASKPLSVAS
jgi:DNA-binding NtrC family response regulator